LSLQIFSVKMHEVIEVPGFVVRSFEEGFQDYGLEVTVTCGGSVCAFSFVFFVLVLLTLNILAGILEPRGKVASQDCCPRRCR
jgi:hypothetical protein